MPRSRPVKYCTWMEPRTRANGDLVQSGNNCATPRGPSGLPHDTQKETAVTSRRCRPRNQRAREERQGESMPNNAASQEYAGCLQSAGEQNGLSRPINTLHGLVEITSHNDLCRGCASPVRL